MNQWVKVKQQGPYEHLFPEEVNYYDPNPVQKIHQRISREGPPPCEWEINKNVFVHVTEQKIVHNFTKRGMTLVTITIPPPRVILSIGGRIHMPNRTIEVGTEFIIGHVRM